MQTQTVVKWQPHLGPQTTFHLQTDRNVYENFYGGAKGPGKTDSLLREGIRQVHIPDYRACIFRRTFPRLGEIIDRSFKYFPGMGARFSGHDMQLRLPAWTFPKPNSTKFEPGAKYAFSHIQNEKDKYNHQGREWHYEGFDQLEEFTQSIYLFIIGQNRTSNKNIKCYIRSTGNPGGVGHAWVKARFILPFQNCPDTIKYFKRVNDEDIETTVDDPHSLSRSFVPAFFYDNPSLLQNDPNYLKRLKQLSASDQQAFIEGNWDVFQGQFFSMWRNFIHVKERPILDVFKKFLSLDYGYGAPSSVGWWQIDSNGHLHRYRELYKERLTYSELAREIRRLTPSSEKLDYCVADPAIWGDKQHHNDSVDGESGAETIQNEWGDFCQLIKADNDRIVGWGRLRILLTGEDGNPHITCSARCKDSIRTIPTLIHDELDVEDLNTDGEDHAADDWRYAVMSRAMKTEIPSEPTQSKSLEWFKTMEKNANRGYKKKEAWEGASRI